MSYMTHQWEKNRKATPQLAICEESIAFLEGLYLQILV